MAAATAVPTSRTRRSSSRPCATPACPPMIPPFRRPWSSCRGARTSRASSTTSRGRPRSTMAVSSTRQLRGTPKQRAKPPKAGDGKGGRSGGDGGPAVLCRHDLRGTQEHDLRRTDARMTPGQGRPRPISAKITRSTKTPARASEAFTTTTRRSPRRWPCSISRPWSTPRAWNTTGESELVAALVKRQEPNGSWVNRDDRFMEGDPNIVTSFGLLALASARTKP